MYNEFKQYAVEDGKTGHRYDLINKTNEIYLIIIDMVLNVYFDFIHMDLKNIFVKKYLKILKMKHFVIMMLVRNSFWNFFKMNWWLFGCIGQLYGLEKFWAFLKYSRQKPKIKPKLEEILKKYKRLEDFRVDGASFPQQFYPTKSGIIVNKKTKISNSLFYYYYVF